MFRYVWPLGLVVISNVFYQIYYLVKEGLRAV